ncbi:autotransporter outer membrane beta-barrel domain-containing protein [Salmonella enterica]|nr:autotransporter outer membrane beta-barrel domain-containing protein [Salmonella enterica subsp. enterica serovar Amina]EEM8035494.1 autotransporter outer membrane beta-barrel domain-containing protein [Salmonella enterica subsp. enterica serovar Enugu]EHU5055078.1 autotransporter outer membrane beta-barrel domain-containing protein [Salmonella enterica]EHU5063661.1 autotransporter outer membrane beta-barrel domain-containing protein [Salmonella enterica]
MAVENKFKLNFIAASVLMGLSLSAVASAEPAQNSSSKTPETTTVTKTLAEAVKAVNPTEVKFDEGGTKDNPSGKDNLDDLLKYMQSADFSDTSARDGLTKSVDYAHGKLLDAYKEAAPGTAKAGNLQKLVAFNRATAEQMVKGDTAALNKTMDTQKEAIDGARNSISQGLKGLSEADSKARAAYDSAIADFLKKTPEEQQDSNVQKQLMDTLTAKNGPLVGSAQFTQISADGGFKTYDELVKETNANPSGNILTSHVALLDAKNKLNDALDSVTAQREKLAQSMTYLANSMPFYTPEEQDAADGARAVYLDALKSISKASTSADSQSKAGDAGKVTHILGSLSSGELKEFDPLTGEYKSVIVNTDGDGKVTGVKDNFTANDLYTGTQDNPFTTTVLDIRALELGNGPLADTNTITVGEAGSKATPVEIWAKTGGDEETAKPAVKLTGNLRTATAQVDENGQPVKGQIVRGADQIHLQNVNIHNSFTLADKAKMMADDMAAINQQATDKLAAGQPATDVGNSRTEQTTALNTKYDKYALTGLQIATTTVNPEFELTDENKAGTFVNNPATVAPDDANILLDNLNITLQNDSTGGTSTAIALSGTGNHILANGGVFDAGSVTGTETLPAQANALYITHSGTNNRIDFNGSVLKGDIRSDAAGNTVNLTNGSLTGDVLTGKNSFSLNLDGNTWTGGTGSANTPDVSLSNNSVWNVTGDSSTNSLALNGNNSLNLVEADGQAQLGGHGFAGTKSGVNLTVATDLTSDGKGVTSVLAGTYSPDNLHGLTNTGSADNYHFGTLHVDGLATGGKYALSLESSGAEPYTIGGRLADGPDATSAHDFVSYMTSENRVVTDKDGSSVTQMVNSDADFTSQSAPAELGVYQYAAEKVMDGVNNRTNIYYSSTGKLSNSAATAVSLAAAPVDVANLESDTLAKHMNSVRHGKDSGVWVSYFGGENRNTTAVGPEYKLKTNGVMLGVDTLTENNWLAGVAVSSARSDMSVMNSSGDLDSYGAQFYMSRRYDSGVFVDSALQFNHFSNTAKARMTDGQQAKADFSGNSYGLEAKVGYAWNSEGFFAEPYVRAAARAFDGEHYALSNGMTVNSNDYKSMLGEVGADLGYQYAISGGYVKPYLHLAALNEFADGNSVRVNNVSLDDSVKGAAFQAGLGAEVKMTDNLGGYAAFDYTKGDNTERPWQATVGVNYTW